LFSWHPQSWLILHFFINRTKERLRSGELWVCGDQWPIFVYANYTYDSEDPWLGLLRSRLLVYVGAVLSRSSFTVLYSTRLSSTSSRPQAQSRESRKPRGPEMLVCMAWPQSPLRLSLTLRPRFVGCDGFVCRQF
jgi:hypothetical protein